MNRFRFLIYLSFAITLNSCIQEIPTKKEKKNNPEFEKFTWLIGTWSSVTDKAHYQETWTKTNDSTLIGFAFMLSKTDTLFSEKLMILFSKKEIFYIAKVPDQNDGALIRFKLTKNERGLHIFENHAHDFPQKILYLMKSNDQMLASVSGVEDGVFHKEDFQLKKTIKK